jgi:hypothetical protein
MTSSLWRQVNTAQSITPADIVKFKNQLLAQQYVSTRQGSRAGSLREIEYTMHGDWPRWIKEALPRLVETANKSASHHLQGSVYYRHDTMCYEMTIRCTDCSHVSSIGVTDWAAMRFCNDVEEAGYWVRYELVPWLSHLMREECGTNWLRELMAEWLTHRLAEAGPAGMMEEEIVRAMLQDFEAPGGEVLAMLRALEFEEVRFAKMAKTTIGMQSGEIPDQPITIEEVRGWRLPPGHIMREW